MGQNRYGKYVVTPPIKMGGPFGSEAEYTGEEHYGSQFSIMFFHITQPVLVEETPHLSRLRFLSVLSRTGRSEGPGSRDSDRPG